MARRSRFGHHGRQEGFPIFIAPILIAAGVGAGVGALSCWAVCLRWVSRVRAPVASETASLEARLTLAGAGADACAFVLIAIRNARASIVVGEETLAAIAGGLGSPPRCGPVLDAIANVSGEAKAALEGLIAGGLAFDIVAGGVAVSGRARGATAWLRLAMSEAARPGDAGAPSRLTALVDAYGDPAWLSSAKGEALWGNRAWLRAVGSRDLDDARAEGLTLDAGADALARAVAVGRMAAERVRWIQIAGQRRALLFKAVPLAGGEVAMWTTDVTQGETTADTLRRNVAAHETLLNQVTDAVVVFGRDRRLSFHNDAFAKLWGLEPAWLADQPSHSEWLDRLRLLGRLPETSDYARFKADELARHEHLEPDPPALWRLPGERTLRVLGQPHPAGGVILIFSDITPELRLNTQFNHLIQVQRATLDKLGDAVAVFGADARLRLHNEAFETLWAITADRLTRVGAFDDIADHCVRRVTDLGFWRDLKGRITSPDPADRAPAVGEVTTADGRRLAWQSRPLPDGATLIGFADVTDARALEDAVREREAALLQSERLKRDFVANVSHQLRTPLTTILGYSELLERGEAAAGGGRGQASAVRQASLQLARLIEKVLDVALLDSGELKLNVGAVDLAGLVVEAAARWEGAARLAGVVLASDAAGAGSIVADAARLGQVLDHLLENALRHTPTGGQVTLSAAFGEGEARLQVADSGRGIPFHVQAHIFDRFSGEDRLGPGLGLALVKALVELHGGWVSLESEPGSGCAVTCHLPAAAS
jgi:signal transduction histidine kinase